MRSCPCARFPLLRLPLRPLTTFGAFLFVVLLLLATSPIGLAQAEVTATIELPPGFVLQEISGLNFPTDMAILPGGDILVLEKGTGDGPDGSALVRVVRNGELRSQPVLVLPTNPFGDSGLLGLAVDPDFSRNGYIYIWHATGEESLAWSGETRNRLSRFTVDRSSLIAKRESERILLDDVPWWIMHNGGGLAFDESGALYLAIGEITRADTAQDLSRYTGKVLRIVPTADGYRVPDSNPFVGDEDVLPEIFAFGLRNPFRITYRASDKQIYIADVGNEAWEEVNRAESEANYGWPDREGPCPLNEQQPCPAASSRFTDPVLYYDHDADMGASITGLDFYEGKEFPEEYHDRLFFADLNLGTIDVGTITPGSFDLAPFASGVRGIVDVEYYDQDIYYLQINGGKIGIISYSGIPNQLPVAAVTADVTLAPSPLTVQFNAQDSFDPDGEIVEYRWDFGDGSAPVVNTVPQINHIFGQDGTYVVQLTVVDNAGALSEAVELEIQAYSGAIPSIDLTNLTEAGRTLFHGGDRWEYAVTRAGDASDLDPERPYTWAVELHHNQHSHPIITGQTAERAIFAIDTDNHGGAWNIGYRFHLYMQTASGQQVHVSDEIKPALVTLAVESSPAPADILVNGGRQPTPHRYRAVVGTVHVFDAPGEILYAEGVGGFDTWHVHTAGWPANEHPADEVPDLSSPRLEFPVPAASTTYTAYYRYLRPADKVFLPVAGR